MKKAQVDVFFAFFAYSGNGGYSAFLPQIGMWWGNTFSKCREDDRIHKFGSRKYGDIPLDMERNKVIYEARELGADILVMVDSDNEPDMYVGHDPSAKAFFDSSFDFVYDRLVKGLPTCISAPYCGPPPHPVKGGEENPYVFYWDSSESDTPEPGFSLKGYSRDQAALMKGIQPAAALPTGLIMYSMSCFDLIDHPYFYYELNHPFNTKKNSTEDVTNTRDISLAGQAKLKEDVVFCNWDSWAGHHKSKCVGKPTPITTSQISGRFVETIKKGISSEDSFEEVNFLPDDYEKVETAYEPEIQEDMGDFPMSETEPDNNPEPDPPEEPPFDVDDDEVEYDENGIPPGALVKRLIPGGRAVKSFGGHRTSQEDLTVLHQLAGHLSDKHGRRIRIAEIGSWVGESAVSMATAFGPEGGIVYCIDDWSGADLSHAVDEYGSEAVYSVFKENVGDLFGETIKPIRQKSLDAADGFDNSELDMVFIDAEHDYLNVKNDIAAWLPHVSSEGYICGHDFCPEFPGVEKAVYEIFDKAYVKLVSSVWIVAKADYERASEKAALQDLSV